MYFDPTSNLFCFLNNKIHFGAEVISSWFRASQFYVTITQQDAAVRSQFYFTAALLYMFRVLSTPIIRSTLNFLAPELFF